MEPKEYQLMAKYEDRHWWFAARRRIFAAFLSRLGLPSPATILDAGCGSGGNLAMLKQFGHVSAAEMDNYARAEAQARHPDMTIEPAHLPRQMPYAGRQFDLITMFDVLEHIDEDAQSLRAVGERLKSGGRLCLSVPALPWLWSPRDLANHHKRRYTLRTLRDVVTQAGYTPGYASYFNVWLFPLLAPAIVLQRLLGVSAENDAVVLPPRWLNTLLTGIFASERRWIGIWKMPFGVSLIMSATKA